MQLSTSHLKRFNAKPKNRNTEKTDCENEYHEVANTSARWLNAVKRKTAFIATVGILSFFWACSFDATGIGAVSQNNNTNNNTPDPICGNNVLEPGEECDGDDLGGATCESLGYSGGTLACLSDCSDFDTSGCETHVAICGNNVLEPGEECDGDDLGGATCESLGYSGGTLACLSDCSDFDTSGCETHVAICGNNVLEPDEECDGDDLGGATCESLGFDRGVLGCDQNCLFDVSDCSKCGDNIINGDEVCDGDDLGGATCSSLGLQSGNLSCLPDCSGYDTSDCLFSPGCGEVDLPVTDYNEVTITNVSINGGSNVAFLSTNESFSLNISYNIMDCDCEGCRDQIEIGFVPGESHLYCAYDGVPGCSSPVQGNHNTTIAAPSDPGVYDIRFGRRQDYGCFHSHTNWWNGTPPESRTIGMICVTD